MAKDNPAKESMDGVITDKRFSRLHSDPRFMRLPRNKFKVQIDSRFQRMFSDKKFSESSAVDKRGKPKKKKDKNALLEYYYRQDQEEEEEEHVNKHNLKNNGDDPDENIGETGRVPRANSFGKIQKKKNKRDEKHGKFYTICEDDHVVSDDCNLSNVTTISNSHLKKKNKKKECETVENYGSLGKTMDDCTYGGDDKIQDIQLMKMRRKKKKEIQVIQLTKTIAKEENKTTDKLFDSNEVLHAETCAGKRGLGSIKKKKKKRNKSKLIDLDENLYTDEGATDERSVRSIKDEAKEISSGSDENMFIEEAQENNRDVKLKNKKNKKNKKNANNDLDDLDRKKYSFKNGLGIQGFEQFKGHHEQVKTQPEVSVALGGHKANGNLSDKLKCKGRLKGSREDLNAIGASNFAKQSQTKAENEDGEKQIEKPSSMFESGKKENNTVGEFLRKHQEDEELSESTSSSGKDVDISESEESEASTSSDDDEDEDDYQIETDYPEEEKVPTVDSETRRLAVVNMDWNHIKAVDLLVTMNSFVPKGGHILSVAVYPSEFGLKQMEEEAVHGPVLFGSDDESNEDDDSEIDDEKLRQYEKARLRYYYAVINCDSSATADYLYKACDGAEFERTSNVMDLRFIPDDMEFSNPPRDVATEVPIGYEAPDFHTRALQHSRVNISWDDDEPLRVRTLNRKYDPKQLNEMDFKAYLASDDDVSDSDEDEEGEDGADDEKKKDVREKYRSLLLDSGDPSEGREDNDDKDMEITFNTGLEKLSKQILERNKKNSSEETVWEAYLRKRSEKRKARKNFTTKSLEEETGSSDGEDASNIDQYNQSDDFFLDDDSGDNGEKIITGSKVEKASKKHSKSKASSSEIKSEEDASKAELELLLADDHGLENSVRGYNLKSNKSKYQKVKESAIEDKLPTVDTDDPRFSALFTSHHFAIDPTNPQFKRSATYSRSIVQKQQKKFADKTTDDLKPSVQKESIVDDASTKKRKTELSSLIKSVKRKVGTLQS